MSRVPITCRLPVAHRWRRDRIGCGMKRVLGQVTASSGSHWPHGSTPAPPARGCSRVGDLVNVRCDAPREVTVGELALLRMAPPAPSRCHPQPGPWQPPRRRGPAARVATVPNSQSVAGR